MPTILSASKAARRLLSRAQQHTGLKDGLGLLMKSARSRGQFVQARGLRNIAGIEYPAVDKVINFDKELNVKGNSLRKMGLSTGQARWFLGCGDGEEGNVLSKTHEERKVMGYSPEQVFAVVAAVDLYEDFVPWCQRSKVVRRNSDGSFDAELEIGFKFLVESYVSHVEMKKPTSIKTTASESSLFDHLINIWEFKPGPVPGTCDLYFFVDFKFQSPLYRQVLGSSRFRHAQSWGTEPISDSPSLAMYNKKFVSETVDNCSGCVCEKCSGEKNGDSGCPCWNMNYELLDLGSEMEAMKECGSNCVCGIDCANRSTQRGVGMRLKIVKDCRKGWCLHAAQFVRRGAFVCEYAGELLTTEEARKRQQEYDRLASSGRFSSALLVVREHLPSGKACLRVNIDATKVGNVARFINHSCDGGNLSIVLVRNFGSLLPRLCFFAARDISDGEELTFSYGVVRLRPKGLPCFCGASGCLGMLPSEET